MPVKYNNIHDKDNFVNQVPITEQIQTKDKNEQLMSKMLANIIEERQKIDNTSVMKMVGALTPVTYYHQVTEASAAGSIANSTGPSDVGTDNKKYQKIKNFLVKLESGVGLDMNGEDDDKTYTASGSMIILPRTIKPQVGDIFIMEYYNKKYTWFVTNVDVATFETDNGFKCVFKMYKKNHVVPESQITSTYVYHHEFTGTTYRPILTPEEYTLLKDIGHLYDHLSDVYNSLFYDKTINGYVFKDYDYEKTNVRFQDNNNINTLGRRGGVLRSAFDGEMYNVSMIPKKVREEAKAYDNYINEFMSKNRIFRNYDDVLLHVEPMLAIDRVGYKRSVYNCLETSTVAYFKNTSVTPVNVEMLQPGVCSYLVGKKNVLYSDEFNSPKSHAELPNRPRPRNHDNDFFPWALTESLVNGKNLDMTVKCTGKVYPSIDSFIIETIVRHVYGKTDDFVDRLKYLRENEDVLYEHEMSYSNIFYLFPLLGYVIERSLERIYSDNVEL